MAPDEVDALLERYLLLLDQYTAQRAQLNSLQAAIYQNIARANFAAERGLCFGQDHYDDRMQASRTLASTADAAGLPRFRLGLVVDAATEEEEGEGEGEAASGAGEADTRTRDESENGPLKEGTEGDDEQAERKQRSEQTRRDPLKWFGYLTPSALRQAQAQAIQAVEGVVPSLAAINAEMAHVEIEVRRARKRRAKAEAVAAKALAEAGKGGGSGSGSGSAAVEQQGQRREAIA